MQVTNHKGEKMEVKNNHSFVDGNSIRHDDNVERIVKEAFLEVVETNI